MGNFFKTVICVLTALIVLAGAAFWGLAGLLPAVDIEDSLRPDAASQYFDDKGELIYTTASEERRIPVSLDKMPKHLQEAFTGRQHHYPAACQKCFFNQRAYHYPQN